MRQDPHIRVLIRLDNNPTPHTPRKHRKDLPRELLHLGVVGPSAYIHPITIRRLQNRRYLPLTMKVYDRAYYQRWYHDSRTRIATSKGVARKARLAVSAAEFMLGRPITSVLDIGCGEGAWRAPLRKLRPGATYLGIESSEYVIARYGKSRNIRRGSFGRLRALDLSRTFDLIVCADVVQYLSDDELRRGLREIRRLAGGVVYIETFAAEDSMEGDRDGWIDRPAKSIARIFTQAGLTHCGFYCWIDERKIRNANRFETSGLSG